MDTGTIITAAISLIGILAVGVLVPIFLVQRAERVRREENAAAADQHREDRDAEWKRQDDVAARAAQTAKAIADQQQQVAEQAAKAAELLLDNNERVAATQKIQTEKLDVIHTLVNSTLTHAMQSEYEAVQRELAVMRELMELKRAAGQEPSAAVLASIDAAETKVNELSGALDDRARAQAKVNQVAEQHPQAAVVVKGAGESGA
jgi:hypothetical protein